MQRIKQGLFIAVSAAALQSAAAADRAEPPPRGAVTGRPEPTLRGDFREVRPSLMTLKNCDAEVEREAREAAEVPKGRAPSAQARAQAVKECEATNARWRDSNQEELARVRVQNASLSADAEKARTRLREEKAVFEAEEQEVARLLADWMPKVDASYRPDGLALLADNAHMMVGGTVAGPFRLIERQSAGSAVVAYGDAYARVEGIPPQVALFSNRPFVMIGKVTEVVSLKEPFQRRAVAKVQWLAGGDCAIEGSPAARAGLGCVPWQGLRRRLPQ